MNAYLCNYRIKSKDGKEFDVTDVIFSTSHPTNGSVGHYWKSLHEMTVVEVYSVEHRPASEFIDFTAKVRRILQ